MEDFDIIFALKLSYLIFAPAEQCSTDINAIDITLQQIMKGANIVISHLISLQNGTIFDHLYLNTVQDSR